MTRDRPAPRPKVFGIGLGKTGTTSLGVALKILGYDHQPFCPQLVQLYWDGRVDELLCHASTKESFEDFPWPLLYRTLAVTFVDAKFILTRRCNDQVWLRSLLDHAERTGPTEAKKIAYGFSMPHGHEAEHFMFYNEHNSQVQQFFQSCPERLLTVCWGGRRWLATTLPVFGTPCARLSISARE
jgi:Sulfotransferase domain